MAPLLLLLLALLLLAVADALPPSCSNVTCGDHVIQYPFSLDSPASDCGYPGLGLVCEDNYTLFLPVKSHRYRVSGIDYNAHTISVSDDDVNKYTTTGGCLRLHVNLTIDTSSWLQLSPLDSNITFVYNCKKNMSWFSAVELSECQQQDGKKSYVLPYGITGAEAYKYECEEVVVAPVLDAHKNAVVDGLSPWNGINGSSGGLVRAGFELMYNTHNQQCGGCERSGGWCGYRHNQTDAGVMKFTCFCDNGPRADRCVSGYGEVR